jgi:dienelactone hydrolase
MKTFALVMILVSAALYHAAGALPKPADLPSQNSLPDPLVMLDGRKVATREMWFKERRPELIRLFQHYMYGQLPPKPAALSGVVERVDPTAFGGKATLSEVTLKFERPAAPPIHLMLVVPNKRTNGAPVVLAINYFGNHTLLRDRKVRLADNWMPERGAGVVANRATEASRGTWVDIWRIEDLIDRGYALATFYNGDVDPDTPDQRGLQKIFRHQDPADDCGSIAAWAWGLQRAVDYLVTAPGIDPRRIILTGHSRMGKAALLAAAFDERIALAIPHQAGCGGSAPSRARIAIGKPYNTLDTARTKPPETVADINDKFPHWFNSRFKEFNQQPERLPFDQNCLVALCAPRPVLFTNGRADTWINPAGQFEVLRGAAPVYRLLGAGDFNPESLPADGELMGGTLGYYLRPGAHSLLKEDWKVFLDFADKHLGRP